MFFSFFGKEDNHAEEIPDVRVTSSSHVSRFPHAFSEYDLNLNNVKRKKEMHFFTIDGTFLLK